MAVPQEAAACPWHWFWGRGLATLFFSVYLIFKTIIDIVMVIAMVWLICCLLMHSEIWYLCKLLRRWKINNPIIFRGRDFERKFSMVINVKHTWLNPDNFMKRQKGTMRTYIYMFSVSWHVILSTVSGPCQQECHHYTWSLSLWSELFLWEKMNLILVYSAYGIFLSETEKGANIHILTFFPVCH